MPVLGECPYDDCTEPLPWMDPPDDPPYTAMVPTTCEGCGRVYWTRLARMDPWSMTEADFLEEYEVDEETRTIKKRESTAREAG